MNVTNGKIKSKLVTTESFGHLSKNLSCGEFLKFLKSEKINKSLCVLQQMKG
jgi:dsRNA-specific ribonuclease